MPYFRNRYRIRRRIRRPVTKAMKENTLVTKRTVNRMIRSQQETKYWQDEGLVAVHSDGLIYRQMSIGQGPDDTQRVGDRVKVKRFTARFALVAGATSSVRLRVILFGWRQQTTTEPAPNLILNNVGSIAGPIAEYNIDNTSKYHIYYDKVHVLTTSTATNLWGTPGVSVGGSPSHTFRIIKNFKGGRNVEFNGPTVNAFVNKGYLGLMFISDVPVGAAAAQRPTIQFSSTLSYTDS